MKGQLSIDSIGPTALSIGVAIITVAVIALVMANMVPATYDENTYYFNHTFTANSTTLPKIDAGGVSIAAVYNDSSQAIGNPGIVGTHWYYGSGNNTLYIITNSTWAGSNPLKSVNYYYTAYTNSTTIVNKGLVALSDFANWFGIIVIVVVAVIILSLVMLLRGRGGEG